MHIRWGTTTTTIYGVKQGSRLSPMEFFVYMDEQSIKLNQSSIGGDIGGHLITCLCYSDA